jgi:hypothetical protein
MGPIALSFVMFGLCVVILGFFQKKIERALELVSFFIAAWIIIYLIIVGIAFIPGGVWKTVLVGFVSFWKLPHVMKTEPGFSWILIANLAAYAATGGVANCVASNWVRDKGYGMGGTVGYISSLTDKEAVALAPVGKVFRVTPENLEKWKGWWRYVNIDQWILYGLGCLVGMFLCVLLATGVIPHGTSMSGLAVGAYQAEYLGKIHRLWFFLTLFNGFWIMFGTQLAITDMFTRFATDAVWMGSERARRWSGENPRKIYYFILLVFVIWGCLGLSIIPKPFKLLQIGATAAAFWFTVVAVHVLVVSHRFIPKELKAGRWQLVGVWGCAIFYLIMGTMVLLSRAGVWSCVALYVVLGVIVFLILRARGRRVS